MKPPNPLLNWTMILPEGQKVTDWHVCPTYRRSDGWEVIVQGYSDIQIGWTYWPKVKCGDVVTAPRGTGWGPSAITACMKWVDDNIPLRVVKPSLERWVEQIRMYLYKDGSREALFLLAECP